MRNSLRKLLCQSALLLAATVAPALQADDLDALLSQPPSASLGQEDAASRIEMVRALIPSHSDRADEIEAYLIPFVRVTQPPPAVPTPEPTPAPAKSKPLLLVKSPDGLSTMRASSRRRQGAVVMVLEETGSRAILQANTIAGELSWFTDAELESGAVDLNGLAKSYETFAKAMPGLRATLMREAGRLREMRQARDRAAAEKIAEVEARVGQVTGAVYDPGQGYTTPALARQLLAAEALRNELPQFAERIDAWAVPFREHFTKLLGGYTYVQGAWVSNEELARAAHEARQEKFLQGLDYQITATALPPDAVRGLFSPFFLKGGFAIFAGLVALILGWRRPYFRLAGAALVALTPLSLAVVFFLATRNPALLPAQMAMAGEQPVVEVLSQAAGLEPMAANAPAISDAALNGFAARHVRIAGEELAEGSPRRQSIIVRSLPGRLAVFEMIESMGLSWIVRIDLALPPSGGPTLVGAKIGALGCPPEFAAGLWKNLEPQLAAILSSSKVAEQFEIRNPAAGTVEFKPAAHPGGESSEDR